MLASSVKRPKDNDRFALHAEEKFVREPVGNCAPVVFVITASSRAPRRADFAQNFAPRPTSVAIALVFRQRLVEQSHLICCRTDALDQILILQLTQSLEDLYALFRLQLRQFRKNFR